MLHPALSLPAAGPSMAEHVGIPLRQQRRERCLNCAQDRNSMSKALCWCFLSTPAPKLDLLWALLCAVEVRTDLGLAKVCLGKDSSHIRAAGVSNSSTKFPLWSLTASLLQSFSEIPFHPPDTTVSTQLSPTRALQASEPYYLKKITWEILFLLKLLLCGWAVDMCVLTLQEEPFFSSLLLWSLDLKLSEILS